MQKTQRKTIAFPTAIINITVQNAKKYGMDFTDYIRFLVTKDAKEQEKVYYMSDETEEALERANKAYENGTLLNYNSADELMKDLLKEDTKQDDE